MLEQAQRAVEAGVTAIQVRERDLDGGALHALVRDIVTLTRGSQTRVLVNDRVDVAFAAGADGVHLRADSMPPTRVRGMAGRGFLIGRSVHGVDEAIEAEPDVDYLTAGTIWPTASKPDGVRLLGVDGLSAIVRRVRVPVLAIGGVSLERAAAVAAAGASGIAAIGLFMAAEPPPGTAGEPADCCAVPLADTVLRLRERFDSARVRRLNHW